MLVVGGDELNLRDSIDLRAAVRPIAADRMIVRELGEQREVLVVPAGLEDDAEVRRVDLDDVARALVDFLADRFAVMGVRENCVQSTP